KEVFRMDVRHLGGGVYAVLDGSVILATYSGRKARARACQHANRLGNVVNARSLQPTHTLRRDTKPKHSADFANDRRYARLQMLAIRRLERQHPGAGNLVRGAVWREHLRRKAFEQRQRRGAYQSDTAWRRGGRVRGLIK